MNREYRSADSIERVTLKLLAGGWVQVCRQNALSLLELDDMEVQYLPPLGRREWRPLRKFFEHLPRTRYRARRKP